MPDNLLWHRSGQRVFNASGEIQSGAKILTYDAGTTSNRTVYQDNGLTSAHANPIVCDSGGLIPDVFLPTGDWKYVITTSADVVLETHDNQAGAVDTSTFLTGAVAPSRVSKSETSAQTMTSAERGKQINCDATGGDFTYTLEAATAGGDSTDIVVKNTGETGLVTVARGGDNPILGPLDSATFRSDGATWHVVEAYKATESLSVVTFDPSIALDLIHPSGTNYQITATGDFTLANPTSVRPGTFFTVTVIQNSAGGHDVTFGSNFATEPTVDIAANAVTVLEFHARTASVIDGWTLTSGESGWDYVACNQQSQNTGGGTATAGAWTDITLNTVIYDRFGLGAPSGNAVPCSPGIWEFEWSAPFFETVSTQSRLYDNTATAEIELGQSLVLSASSSDASSADSRGWAKKTLTVASNISVQYQCSATVSGNGLGRAANFSSERYLIFKARKTGSL